MINTTIKKLPLHQPLMQRLLSALLFSALLHAAAVAGIDRWVGADDALSGAVTPAAAMELHASLSSPAPAEPQPAAALPSDRIAQITSAPGTPAARADAATRLPGPHYYIAKELDQRPMPVTDIAPQYPGNAGPNGGVVVAKILINEKGRADKVLILSATPAGQFEQAVIDAFGAASYLPGMKNRMAVKSQMKVEVTFHPEDRPAAAPLKPAAGKTGK